MLKWGEASYEVTRVRDSFLFEAAPLGKAELVSKYKQYQGNPPQTESIMVGHRGLSEAKGTRTRNQEAVSRPTSLCSSPLPFAG